MKEGGLFINGKWIRGGARLEVRSPYDQTLVGVLPSASPQMVEAAISSAIAAASIVAKVTRDRLMDGLHLLDPRYGFDRHKGYATAEHLAAVGRQHRWQVGSLR